MDKFTVKINEFDGPLDLMLHLIREQKMDLFDLDMNLLTDQYIAYLNQMKDLHLEIASEYLVELATLIEYKSKKMVKEDKLDMDEEENPRNQLIKRLLEYQQYKEASQELLNLYESRQLLMGKPQSEEIEKWLRPEEELKYNGSPYDLMKAMRRCLLRIQLSKPIETKYTIKEVSMEDREIEIRAMLDTLPEKFKFDRLVEDCEDISMFIATFLAVLDLTRQHKLFFTITDDDTIWFSRGDMSA